MKNSLKKCLLVLALILVGLTMTGQKADAASKKTYTISTKTKPYYSKYRSGTIYNSKTKHYYVLRSYLERLGANGGGTLVLKKGTYKICRTLYVPSNVTIKLKTGTTLKKTTSTGTKKVKSSKYMFALVKSSKATGKKMAALKASRNVKIQGSGKATINMGKVKSGIAIAMAHNYNVTVKGIQFKARKGGSYIAVSGCRKVTVDNCKFYEGTTLTGSDNVYAIRLETATKATDSFGFSWSKLDNSTNRYITVSDSLFAGMRGAIGSVKYAVPKIKKVDTILYQENITIKGNKFRDISSQAVKPMVWKDAKITGNKFYRNDKTKKTSWGILAKGVVNPTFENNSFNYIAIPIEFDVATNNGKGKGYSSVKNSVESKNTSAIQNNTVYNADHYYVPYNNGSASRLTYYQDKAENNLSVTTDGVPYREHYSNSGYYGTNTEDYFKFRAAMEQLEYTGGGTLTVKAGTYDLSNAVYVPSNVTIVFEEGVVIDKVAAKYTTSLTEAKSMFVLCEPSKAKDSKTIGAYNGAHDITFKGTGTTQVNCNNKDNAIAVVMGHCNNVNISGIRFARYYGYHLIEMNSSQNVTVEGCGFSDFTPSTTDLTSVGEEKDYKEAINIDGSDGVVGGFNYGWSNGDKTTCNTITIRNNSFLNIGSAIGSHNYSAEGVTQLYHSNINISNNTISTTLNSGIRGLNWQNTSITGNTFQNIGKDDNGEYGVAFYGVYLRGAVNVTVKSNMFNTCYYPVHVVQSAQVGSAGYPATVSQMTPQNWLDMMDNTLVNCRYSRVRVSNTYLATDFPAGIVFTPKTDYNYLEYDESHYSNPAKK